MIQSLKPLIVFHEVDSQLSFFEHNENQTRGPLALNGSNTIRENLYKIKKCSLFNIHIKSIATTDFHFNHEVENPELFPEFSMFSPHCMAYEMGAVGADRINEVELYPTQSRVIIPHHVMINNKFTLAPYSLEENMDKIISPSFEIIIRKNGLDAYSAFTNPRTEKVYEILSPKMVYIYGVATEFCVKHATIDLIDRGYNVTIIEDAIKGLNEDDSNQVLKDLSTKGAEFITTDELLLRFPINTPTLRSVEEYDNA